MDYEKKYNELVEAVRELQESNPSDEGIQNWVNDNVPELAESKDEKIRKGLIEFFKDWGKTRSHCWSISIPDILAWLEKQGTQKSTLPKWKYKNDNTPLLRDSLILNKYGCVAKSPSGAIVSDVWVIDYNDLAKLPKKEYDKQGGTKDKLNTMLDDSLSLETKESWNKFLDKQKPVWSREDEQNLNAALGYINDEHLCRWLKDAIHAKYDKTAWSEEDEKIALSIEQVMNCASLLNIVPEKVYKIRTWLKSLKDRVQPQPKQEWSEEDEEHIKQIIEHFEGRKKDLKTQWVAELYNKEIDWLKSLKERYTWKPSDEQIKACKEVYADLLSAKGFDICTVNSELNRLEKDLKKLKGE